MKYLIELLKEENTVIIPGLGALTVVNRNPLDLKFMSYLKFNDGTLVKFIAQQDGIEQDVAKEKIDAFVAEVTAVLEQGNTYEIPEVGVLSKDASGDIQITSMQTEKVVEEVVIESIEEKKELIEEVKDKILPVIEEPIVTETVTEVIQEEIADLPVSEQIVEEKIEIVEDKIVETIEEKVEPVVVPVSEVTEPIKATEEEQWNDDLDLPPLNYQPERPKTAILEKTKKDKKPKNYRQLWLLLIAAIVIGGSAYVGFNYKDLKESIPFLANKETEKQEKSVESTESEAPEPQEEIVEPVEEQVENVVEEKLPVIEEKPVKTEKVRDVPLHSGSVRVDKTLPIQVIVGSFGEEANANRMVEKLTSQGFSAAVIGVYGGLHTVSAGSFNTMDEFRANQSKFESVGKYWVKK